MKTGDKIVAYCTIPRTACPEFWDWLPKAYNFAGNGVFTKYNMEVAFLAGKQFSSTAPSRTSIEHAVIAGVLFDFMGWLTSRQERLVLSSCDDASLAVKVIQEFAIMRGLSLDDAKVKDWQDMIAPPRKKWVGLDDEDWMNVPDFQKEGCELDAAIYDWIEARLKEKNT